jgi:hypothetical protein
MTFWLPYATTMARQPDFLVSYSFRSSEDGGRTMLPFQGYRSDLRYQQNHILDGAEYDGNYMVWPEFLTPSGTVIDQIGTPVPRAGTAFMWIVHLEQYNDIHRRLATPGVNCWFMEGSRKVADCVVIEQIALIHRRIL